MKIQWIGGPTFRLELGTFCILADPVFGAGDRAFMLPSRSAGTEGGVPVARRADLPDVSLEGVDVVILTNRGVDHFDPAAADRLDESLPILGPAAGDAKGAGATAIEHLEWWQESTQTRSSETLSIIAVPTRLPSSLLPASSNGYLIKHTKDRDVYTVYCTGGTVWFSEARDIKARAGTVDLMVVELGAVGAGETDGPRTLDGKDAMQFVFLMLPKRIIPIGHHTFSHYTEGIGDFQSRIDLTMYDRRLVVLSEGEAYERGE